MKCICAGNPPTLGPPCKLDGPPPPLWPWIAGGLALAGAGVATILVLRRRDDAEVDVDDEPPAPEPALPPPVAPPIVEARRTVGLRPFALEEDGIPLIGWIVPVSGSAAFQTFRLGDRTVIGAAADCDVRLDDPGISAHHAEIFLHGGDFVLLDRDSRNGVHFYDKKVQRHTLVDNDLFTLGSTSFKFKWTM